MSTTTATATESTYHDVVMGTLRDFTIAVPGVKRLTAKRAGELMRELAAFAGVTLPENAAVELIEAEGKSRFYRVGDLTVVNHQDGTTSYTHAQGGGSGLLHFMVAPTAEPARTTEYDSLFADASGEALINLNVAPMSWRVGNVQTMVREVINGWRAFGVITDKAVEVKTVLDMEVSPEVLTGTDAERLHTALTVGARIAHHHMETSYASTGGGRMFYSDRLAKSVATTAVRRGVFFMTEQQVKALDIRTV